MSTPPANVRRHFLPWHRPLLPQAVDWLAGDWRGEGPLDLSRVLVVVPTRQSGRRLREALAARAAVHAQAAFAPRILTPDALVASEPGTAVASRLEALLAWTDVFRALELEGVREVFLVDPAVRNFSWALQLAQEFTRLQQTLGEAGLRLADIPARAGEAFVEAERWRQIAGLGERHAARLADVGLHEPQAARIAAARNPATDQTAFDRVVLLAVPDPQPLALARLVLVAGTVDVVIFAPETEGAVFDDWGRPLPAAWEKRVLAIQDFEQRVHLGAGPAAQAEQLAALVEGYAQPEGVVALGVGDLEVIPWLDHELRRQDRPAFNPDGRPMRDEALYQLLTSLAAIAREPSFANVETLARCPDFFGWVGARSGRNFSVARWLAGLDQLRARHLPADLAAAREYAPRLESFPEVAIGLEAMNRLRSILGAGAFGQGSAEALREIYGGRQLELRRELDARLQAAAEGWMGILRECADAELRFGVLAPAEAWDLALRMFGDQRRADEKPAGAMELQGWLELLWEDAPHLAVAGMNDGRVPEAVVEDAFLPESLRAVLGLKTNAARLARDAYILQAIAACRGGGSAAAGRLDLMFGKTSATGEPLRPSRLLFRCPDAELPDRIAFLFRAPAPAHANSSWTRAWKLVPRVVPPPERVAVTALRRYLLCPFRFYLRHVLKMEGVDPLKTELDAFDFGILCHAALEQIGLDPGLRDCTEPVALRSALLHHFERAVRSRYGQTLSLPLLMQVESARQRLGRLAELQAAERAAGWIIAQVERPFEIEMSGLKVRGKIDRIDRHATTGEIRVLDYKTSDTPVTPAAAHLRALRPGEQVPAWARFDVGGKPRVWFDLQLPLYLRALAAEFPGRIACGYFNLPKAAGETALALWDDYTLDLQEAAMRCADGACAAIRAGDFWPPNESLPADRDEYAPLFHHGCADSVEWRGAGASSPAVADRGIAPVLP